MNADELREMVEEISKESRDPEQPLAASQIQIKHEK